jgi:pimeloyl-ACP methyl ester carboxylesterase
MLYDLEAAIDALALECFALLGISGGAATSIAYAVPHPHRVSKLVLFEEHAPSVLDESEPDGCREMAFAGAGRTEQQEGEKHACRTMVGLLALAHDRACEAALADTIDADLDANALPDLDRYAPERATCPPLRIHKRVWHTSIVLERS